MEHFLWVTHYSKWVYIHYVTLKTSLRDEFYLTSILNLEANTPTVITVTVE